MMLTHELFVSLVILICCVACNRLILSLRGLYYSQAVGASIASGMRTSGRATIQVYPPSSDGVTSLDRSTCATSDEEKMT